MIKRVGFVGVGTMGEPMATNLLKAGFDVVVVAHRRRERWSALSRRRCGRRILWPKRRPGGRHGAVRIRRCGGRERDAGGRGVLSGGRRG